MKTPHLLASFAVAATAAAANVKDSTEVAREWNETIVQSSPPLTGDLSLRGSMATQSPGANPWATPPAPRANPILREELLDAPGYRVPDKLPNDRPRGAIPWEYNGQVYWLVPLTPPAGK